MIAVGQSRRSSVLLALGFAHVTPGGVFDATGDGQQDSTAVLRLGTIPTRRLVQLTRLPTPKAATPNLERERAKRKFLSNWQKHRCTCHSAFQSPPKPLLFSPTSKDRTIFSINYFFHLRAKNTHVNSGVHCHCNTQDVCVT